MRISFVEPIKQSACSPEGIVIALLRQIPCRNSQPNEQSIVIIAAHGEHYLPVLFVVAHDFSGSTVTLALAFCPFSPVAVTVTTVACVTLGATSTQLFSILAIVPAVVLQVTAWEQVATGWTLVRNSNWAWLGKVT